LKVTTSIAIGEWNDMVSSFFCAMKQLEARIIKKGKCKKVDEQPRLALREEGGLQDGASHIPA
jgi:hypothetical protein